jgi:hypothetical protein
MALCERCSDFGLTIRHPSRHRLRGKVHKVHTLYKKKQEKRALAVRPGRFLQQGSQY